MTRKTRVRDVTQVSRSYRCTHWSYRCTHWWVHHGWRWTTINSWSTDPWSYN